MDVDSKQILEAVANSYQASEAGDWSATLQFNLDGDKGGKFYLTIGDGKCTCTEGETESASCTINSTGQMWIDIALGKQNPMTAFMTGKVKVQGNMGDVMKLQNKKIFPAEPPPA